MNVLAIDQGTSATKALVVGPGHRVLAAAEVPVRPRATHDGGVEQDPEELWNSVVEAGRRALAAAGEPVAAVGLSNQGETVLAWDRASSTPLSTSISWQDGRAVDVCDRLRDREADLRAITGLPLDPYFSAPKIVWLREHVTTEGVVTTTDAWLLHRLTGAYVTDASTASRTLLLDLDEVAWSDAACAIFGLDPATLPSVAPCAGMIGETSVFGTDPLPVTGVAVDQQAALFAESCLAAGEAKCTYGTGAFLLATVGREPRRSRSGLVGCVAWSLDGSTTYCLDGQVYTVGAAVSWLEQVGLIVEPSDLDRVGGSVGSPAGVTFVPGLAGLAAPFWKPNARGAFTGISLATERGHLVRSVMEGVAAGVAFLASAAGEDLGKPLGRLRVDGGLTRSTTLMQIQADLLQTPVEVYPSTHATALGVAAFARLGVGDAADAVSATSGWVPAATFEPKVGPDEASDRLARWRAAAEATIDLGA